MKRKTIGHLSVFLGMCAFVVLFMSVAGAKEVRKFYVGDEVQWRFQHLYDNCGVECLLTFEAESGLVLDSVSGQNRNGTRDYGFCQLNSQYHSPFIFGFPYERRKAHWNKLQNIRYIMSRFDRGVEYYKWGDMEGDRAYWQKELDLATAFMIEMSTYTKGFLDARTQLDYCISVFHDAKKKGRIRTTWYAFAHINTRPGVRDRFNITK